MTDATRTDQLEERVALPEADVSPRNILRLVKQLPADLRDEAIDALHSASTLAAALVDLDRTFRRLRGRLLDCLTEETSKVSNGGDLTDEIADAIGLGLVEAVLGGVCHNSPNSRGRAYEQGRLVLEEREGAPVMFDCMADAERWAVTRYEKLQGRLSSLDAAVGRLEQRLVGDILDEAERADGGLEEQEKTC
jgi:hypothetical protein